MRRAFHSSGPLLLTRGVVLLLSVGFAAGVPRSAAQGATLESLFDGGTLLVDDVRFSQWELLSLAATSVPNVDLSLIDVLGDASQVTRPGIGFVANGQLTAAGVDSIDLVFRFRVGALAGADSLVGHKLELNAIGFSGAGGVAYISGEAASSGDGALDSTLVSFDNTSGFSQSTSEAAYAPHSNIWVTMNVFLSGTSNTSNVNLGTFSYFVDQTGPPGLLGDYNTNGVVDAADYVTWRNLEGQMGPGLAADGDHDQDVDADDYEIWRSNFGATVGNASSGLKGGTNVVPEPASLVLLLVGPLVGLFSNRCRARGTPA